jgi:hypothetical protein
VEAPRRFIERRSGTEATAVRVTYSSAPKKRQAAHCPILKSCNQSGARRHDRRFLPHGARCRRGRCLSIAMPGELMITRASACAPPCKRNPFHLLRLVEHLGSVHDPLTTTREIDKNLVAKRCEPLRFVIRLRADDAVALAAPATIAAAIDDDMGAVSNRALRLRGKIWLSWYRHYSSPAV